MHLYSEPNSENKHWITNNQEGLTMKKLLTAAALASTLLISVQVLHAEEQRPMAGHSPEQMIERMAERLNLTEEQKNNIKPILEQEFEKMRALRQERQQKIESFLTEEQKQQLQQRRDDRKKGCKGKEKDDDRD